MLFLNLFFHTQRGGAIEAGEGYLCAGCPAKVFLFLFLTAVVEYPKGFRGSIMLDCISVENMRRSDAETIAKYVPSLELIAAASF